MSIPMPALGMIVPKMDVDYGQEPKRQRIVSAIVEKANLNSVKPPGAVKDSDGEPGEVTLGLAVSSDCQARYVLTADSQTANCDAGYILASYS